MVMMTRWRAGICILFVCATGRCEDPQLSITDDSVMAVGYRNLSVNGTVVTFSCPRGQTLTGPNSVMCTHSGQWEPPPSAVNCSEDTNNSSKNYMYNHASYCKDGCTVLTIPTI